MIEGERKLGSGLERDKVELDTSFLVSSKMELMSHQRSHRPKLESDPQHHQVPNWIALLLDSSNAIFTPKSNMVIFFILMFRYNATKLGF